MSEFSLRIPVCNWLNSRGLSPVLECASLSNCDIVGCRFAEKPIRLVEMVAVELKLRDVAGVLRQCESHMRRSINEVWAAMPIERAKQVARRFKEIGLLGVDGDVVEIVVPAAVKNKAQLHPWKSSMWRRRNEWKWRMEHPLMLRFPAQKMLMQNASSKGETTRRINQVVVAKAPAVVAWDKWIESDAGHSNADPATLEAPARSHEYLRNRLYRAFMDGWDAAEIEKGKVGA